MKYPKVLYIVKKYDGDGHEFYVAIEDERDAVDEAGNQGEVALYDFNQSCEARIVRSLKVKEK